MKLVYTEKAEVDGVGKAGAVVPADPELGVAYLLAHDYAKEAKTSGQKDGAMGAPTSDGSMSRKR